MIREAATADLRAVRAIAESAYAPFVSMIGKEPAPMVADFAAQIEEGSVDVLLADNAVKGYCVSYPDGAAWHVENLAVLPAEQGNGFGRSLLAHAETQARNRGFETIELYTNVAMTGALRFYPRIGYVELYRREVDGFNRAYFRKNLT